MKKLMIASALAMLSVSAQADVLGRSRRRFEIGVLLAGWSAMALAAPPPGAGGGPPVWSNAASLRVPNRPVMPVFSTVTVAPVNQGESWPPFVATATTARW